MNRAAENPKTTAVDSDRKSDDRAPFRKAAEWITMIVSALIVLSLAGFLGYHATQEDGDEIPVLLTPMLDSATQVEGSFLLPLQIRNRGRRTIQDFRGELTFVGQNGQPDRRQFELDYLGEQAEQEVHIFLPHHPRELKIEVTPLSYRLE